MNRLEGIKRAGFCKEFKTHSRWDQLKDRLLGRRPRIIGVDLAAGGDMSTEVEGYRRPDGTLIITSIKQVSHE